MVNIFVGTYRDWFPLISGFCSLDNVMLGVLVNLIAESDVDRPADLSHRRLTQLN
jgi:hypothetical protein